MGENNIKLLLKVILLKNETMAWWLVIVLAVIQGVAEFLPISSSGHLFLLEKLTGADGDILFFNIMLHLASALGIVIALWPDVKKMFTNRRVMIGIGLATIPGVVGGLLLKDYIDGWAQTYIGLAIGFAITGIFMLLIGRIRGREGYEKLNWLAAVKIGLFQMLALMPGISRSGSTMLGGKIMKLDQDNAVRYSFLLALPIIFGASGYEFLELYLEGSWSGIDWVQTMVGSLICLVVSVATIHYFVKYIKQVDLKYFGYYTLVLAIIVVVLNFL